MLAVTNISFSYGTNPILEDVSFTIPKGEHISLIGESGCGKSTLLKLIYGIYDLNKGEIFWKDTPILGPLYNLLPGGEYVKYLSQNFDLMPHTTVFENVSQYLSVFYPEELKKRTYELLDTIEMTSFAETKVKLLSGGQQQRVALARVLAQQPELLLLDEPFSHIDNFRKNGLRRNLFNYLKKEKITVLTATHDPNDILPYADQVIVLKDTKILAQNTPKKLYEHPNNLYVASLFGEANKIPIHIVKSYADTKRKIIVYASEFKVSNKSGLEVEVSTSYYQGGQYLVEGIYEEEKIFFYHNIALETGKKVFLNVSIETINQRLV
ncbi:ABC transporter ATP-binding protein [uncultured Maribacter sp.]|uniref:ABC transporter ATP-binding protein n=1 Tax=uncultured Maribacter sp. TaxID=431308 RepID=UPI002624E455|nr:ABC transporter ATP-binding protein [uncultured Maribacter sp.]